MKRKTIIASAAIAAVVGTVAYFLWQRRKKNEPLLEEFDTHYHSSIAPNVKKAVKHATNAFTKAKDHLQEAGYGIEGA